MKAKIASKLFRNISFRKNFESNGRINLMSLVTFLVSYRIVSNRIVLYSIVFVWGCLVGFLFVLLFVAFLCVVLLCCILTECCIVLLSFVFFCLYYSCCVALWCIIVFDFCRFILHLFCVVLWCTASIDWMLGVIVFYCVVSGLCYACDVLRLLKRDGGKSYCIIMNCNK